MSVILDALQKARGDRHKNQVEPHPNSVARVLEPTVAGAPEPPPRHAGGWLLAVFIIIGSILLLALAGGAFYLLYDQVRRLQPQAAVTTAPIVPPAATDPGAIATPSLEAELAVSPGALPPPLPLSDLPIQPPAAASAGAPGAGTELPVSGPAVAAPSTTYAPAQAAPAAPAATAAPQFKLGSIVCEDNVCMALINGRTVRQGDRVKDYVVTEITDKGVTLKSSSGSDEIHLDLYN